MRYRNLLSFIIIIYLGFGGFLYVFQERFIYHPTPELINHNLATEGFQLHDGITIKAFVLNPGHSDAVLYFGGNAESVGLSAPGLATALAKETVYLINYRGYGGSTGIPSEQGLYSDALRIFDRLKRRHRDIAVIGRSLGTGVATYLAAKRNIKRLVLVTPFDSIENIAQKRYPIYPVGILLRDKYDSLNRAERIRAKVLILIAENDHIIERSSSWRLIKGFDDAQTEVSVIENTGHNSISSRPEYYRAISRFLSVSTR